PARPVDLPDDHRARPDAVRGGLHLGPLAQRGRRRDDAVRCLRLVLRAHQRLAGEGFVEHAVTPAHAAHAEHETSTGLDHRKIAMWAFLGSDCLFFGSFISTYMIYRGRSIVGPCPHACVINGVHYEGIFSIPYTSVSAFVLLMSSVTMVLALAAIQRGNHRGLRVWLLATALLGAVFVGGQYFEFTSFWQHGLHLSVNLFGTTFFVLTGFHG